MPYIPFRVNILNDGWNQNVKLAYLVIFPERWSVNFLKTWSVL